MSWRLVRGRPAIVQAQMSLSQWAVLVLESRDEAMAPYRMLRATSVILGAFLPLPALG